MSQVTGVPEDFSRLSAGHARAAAAGHARRLVFPRHLRPPRTRGHLGLRAHAGPDADPGAARDQRRHPARKLRSQLRLRRLARRSQARPTIRSIERLTSSALSRRPTADRAREADRRARRRRRPTAPPRRDRGPDVGGDHVEGVFVQPLSAALAHWLGSRDRLQATGSRLRAQWLRGREVSCGTTVISAARASSELSSFCNATDDAARSEILSNRRRWLGSRRKPRRPRDRDEVSGFGSRRRATISTKRR